MKTQLFYISFFVIIFSSCTKDPGKINGVATFFFNKYQGYKPDIGAKVYVTKLNCDSIKDFLFAEEINSSIEFDKSMIKEYKSMSLSGIEDLENQLKDSQIRLNKYAKDSADFRVKEVGISGSLFAIRTDKNTLKTTVDGVGNYSIEVPPGDYYVIFISSGRKKSNMLESSGNIIVESVKVESKKTANVDAKFEL
jgi:hypothetical protein